MIAVSPADHSDVMTTAETADELAQYVTSYQSGVVWRKSGCLSGSLVPISGVSLFLKVRAAMLDITLPFLGVTFEL
jgi:hypothetical protein